MAIKLGKPERNEAAPYYFNYIDLIGGDNIVEVLEQQLRELPPWLDNISESESLRRYAPDKWSIRELLSHVNDTERVLVSRAFWFARNFLTELPSFDQNVSVAATQANEVPWSVHVKEFEAIRLSTVAFFRNLPDDAWMRKGIASGYPFTVRSLAYVIAGHTAHHQAILEERYWQAAA
jgi:hypothetical protein